jgi:O-antigen ligase
MVALLGMLIVVPLRRRQTIARALAVALLGIGAVATTLLVAPSMVRSRFDEAKAEIEDSVEHDINWSSTGLRLALWRWAAQVWQSAPAVGVGAGDFRLEYQQLDDYARSCAVAREHALTQEVPGYAQAKAAGQDVTRLRQYRRGVRTGEAHVEYLTRDHAHSTYMQTLANQGLVGLTLLLMTLGAIARQCWRDRPDHPYADGMLFAMVVWVVGAQFDCYELNGHQLGLLALIAALTLPGRAPVRWRWSASD